MSVCNSQSFTQAKPSTLLWRNTLPMVGAILALLAYDLLESSLLAFQSEQLLASFGFTLPITTAMTALAIGLSIRANNKVVHRNCTDKENLSHEISNCLLNSLVIVSCFSLVFYLCREQLLLATGNSVWLSNNTNEALKTSQLDYMSLRYLGWVFLALMWQVNAVLRALGWMQIASGLMLSWASFKGLVAVALLTPESPLFQQNLVALAWVHILADGMFALISLWFLKQKVSLKRPKITLHEFTNIQQKKDGLLVIAQQFVTPISMAILTAIAATIDTSYVAALALLFRLEVLFLLLPMVLTTSLPAIVGANFWLGQQQRVTQLYKLAFWGIVLFQLIVAALVYSQSHLLSSYVCPHDAIAMHLEHYLMWVPWGYGAAGIAIVLQSCLNAKNKTGYATLLGIFHRLLFVLPLTAMGVWLLDDYGFYQGLMLGHLCAFIAVAFVLRRLGYIKRTKRQTSRPLEELNHEV